MNIGFERKKKIVFSAMLDWLLSALFVFLLAGMIALAAYFWADDDTHRRNMFVAACIVAGIGLIFIILALIKSFAFTKLEKVKSYKTQTKIIHCQQIRFIFHPNSRYTRGLLGFYLISTDNKKYIYVFDPPHTDSKSICKIVKETLIGEIQIEYYNDSLVLASFPQKNIFEDKCTFDYKYE